MCYANISIVTNFAAGIAPGVLTHSEVLDMMQQNIKGVKDILMGSIKYIPDYEGENSCDCRKILNEPGVMK
jgi:5'-methylthioadenosine phosphorylase